MFEWPPNIRFKTEARALMKEDMGYWIRTKTNRLKAPKRKSLDPIDISGATVNWCGEPVAKIGDFVYLTGSISAGTVGRLVGQQDLGRSQPGFENHYGSPDHWISGDIETLDGKVNSEWLWTISVIPYTAVQEVKDFYINDGRPDRIKVSW
jgi:hypothetical protein